MNDENTRPLFPRDEHDDEPTSAFGPEPAAEHEPVDPGDQLWAPPVDDESGGRHPLGVAHLVTGLIFLGIAASWLLRETGVVDADGTQWFLPLTLVVAGAIGLLAWLSSARGTSR